MNELADFGSRRVSPRDPMHVGMSMPHQLPRRIVALRSTRKLSRKKLADAVGVSVPTLWAWETGRKKPRPVNLAALAQAFAVSERELVAGGGRAAGADGLDDLKRYVEEARRSIADLARVDPEKVRISIDL